MKQYCNTLYIMYRAYIYIEIRQSIITGHGISKIKFKQMDQVRHCLE